MVVKVTPSDDSKGEIDVAYLTRRFNKIVMKHRFQKGGLSKPTNITDLCHKCRKSGHYMRNCPMLKQEY